MLLPLGTDRPLRRPTLVNYVLVAVNVGVFLAATALENAAPEAWEWLYTGGWLAREPFRWWTLVTHAFLHAGALHLAGNLVSLWVFGANVEDKLGRVGYLLFYLAGGVLAGLAH